MHMELEEKTKKLEDYQLYCQNMREKLQHLQNSSEDSEKWKHELEDEFNNLVELNQLY